MNVSDKERYALDKVALLVIFALGLLLAQLLVSAKSRLRFSEPLELPYAGVSVRMPQGNGWHSENTWQFIANAFTISSVFSPTTGRITASVEVRYMIAPEENRPDRQIDRYSKELAGTVIETGKIQYTDVLIEWAHIAILDKYLDVFLGVALLPNGRGLSIEVQGPSSDAGWMEQIFTGTAEAVSFEDNYLLENGRKIVEKLKTSGLAQLTLNHNQQRFFLIEDEKKQILGFMTDLLTISTDKDVLGVKFAEFYHIRTRQGSLGRHSLFQGDQKLRQFLWFSKASGLEAIGETTVQVELNEEGQMTVEAYTPPVSRNYTIGPAAIPEIFLEQLIGLFVESRFTEALVDSIFFDGRIIPIRLSAVDPSQDDADPPAAYTVRLDFLDQQGYYGQIYLDNNKETFQTTVHRENTYIFRRSNKNEVLKNFPMWRDYFLQMEKQGEAQ